MLRMTAQIRHHGSSSLMSNVSRYHHLHQRWLLLPLVNAFALATTFASVKTHYVCHVLIHSLIIFSKFMIIIFMMTSMLETCMLVFLFIMFLLYSKFNHVVANYSNIND